MSKWREPIVVGYAFGPKKMSTMGVVMAEASRVKVFHKVSEEVEEQGEHDVQYNCTLGQPLESVDSCEEKAMTSVLTSVSLEGLEQLESAMQSKQYQKASSPLGTTVITLGNSDESSDLRHIVRNFRSNYSSAAGSLASTCETSGCSTRVSVNDNSICTKRRRKSNFPVLISFVPLDPNQPLEEQHGGKFDLILHKLTEDILSCSLQDYSEDHDSDDTHVTQRDKDPSWRRVQALLDYNRRNRHCCMVDNPRDIQTVMNRSDIGNVLQNCLKNAHTKSGIPVRSPRFVVIPDIDDPQQRGRDLIKTLHQDNQELSTPLIVKPLIAAGTKQSHFMLIALQESAFVKLPPKTIVQEFINHNATLYKVYVLGDFVSVYERHSLPDLPEDLSTATVDLVEFDSQRPYPNLTDFGLNMDASRSNIADSISRPDVAVTVAEVMPIVDALKKAFVLELFGFDILRRSNYDEWMVVDVNYFPSYKEVPNFPSLLARYLTRRVLEQRSKSWDSLDNAGNRR